MRLRGHAGSSILLINNISQETFLREVLLYTLPTLGRYLQAQQLCSADVSTVHKAFYEDHRPEDFVEGR